MTLEKAIRTAKEWVNGGVCTLKDGELEEYNKLVLDALLLKAEAERSNYK